MHQAIDLLQVIRQLQHVEDLDERRDDACVLQDHGIQEFQAYGVRQRESLTKEVPHLLDVNLASAQESGHIHRVISGHPTGDQERQPEPGLAVEDERAYSLKLLLELLGSDDRLSRHEKRLVLQPAAHDVLRLIRVKRELPRLPRRLLLVKLIGANRLIGAVVSAKLRRHLTLAVPLVQLCTSLQQSNHNLASADVDRNV
mmetsp:Transcript_103554/g.246551  ORF Transcript_103554/g.246551 Transcript_103554/m.246551 type:complete len:200 (+) Transcript_103554:794-1393(+)